MLGNILKETGKEKPEELSHQEILDAVNDYEAKYLPFYDACGAVALLADIIAAQEQMYLDTDTDSCCPDMEIIGIARKYPWETPKQIKNCTKEYLETILRTYAEPLFLERLVFDNFEITEEK